MSETPEDQMAADEPQAESSSGDAPADAPKPTPELIAIVESLLFLSADPVKTADLAEATDTEPATIEEALAELQKRGGGIVLREIGGGWTLASIPQAERAARRLLAKPRTPPLTQAQAECLSIVAYLQPVSRPEIARIRGVASESAVATLEERGLIEDCGRSQFGAILYRTTPLFQRLFGLASMDALPDPTAFDPSPEEEGELRERLLRAGEVRAGGAAGQDALPAPAIAAAAADEQPAAKTARASAESLAGGDEPEAEAAGDADASIPPFAGRSGA
jgi:segregation and condensation protein B